MIGSGDQGLHVLHTSWIVMHMVHARELMKVIVVVGFWINCSVASLVINSLPASTRRDDMEIWGRQWTSNGRMTRSGMCGNGNIHRMGITSPLALIFFGLKCCLSI